MSDFSELKGKTLKHIEVCGTEEIYFVTTDNEVYRMWHDQDCCESVQIEEICGDLNRLLHSPIGLAEEVTNTSDDAKDEDDSFTWTFYRLATNHGFVTIRWYGTSNGYYSESVDFDRVEFENSCKNCPYAYSDWIHNDSDVYAIKCHKSKTYRETEVGVQIQWDYSKRPINISRFDKAPEFCYFRKNFM